MAVGLAFGFAPRSLAETLPGAWSAGGGDTITAPSNVCGKWTIDSPIPVGEVNGYPSFLLDEARFKREGANPCRGGNTCPVTFVAKRTRITCTTKCECTGDACYVNPSCRVTRCNKVVTLATVTCQYKLDDAGRVHLSDCSDAGSPASLAGIRTNMVTTVNSMFSNEAIEFDGPALSACNATSCTPRLRFKAASTYCN